MKLTAEQLTQIQATADLHGSALRQLFSENYGGKWDDAFEELFFEDRQAAFNVLKRIFGADGTGEKNETYLEIKRLYADLGKELKGE